MRVAVFGFAAVVRFFAAGFCAAGFFVTAAIAGFASVAVPAPFAVSSRRRLSRLGRVLDRLPRTLLSAARVFALAVFLPFPCFGLPLFSLIPDESRR